MIAAHSLGDTEQETDWPLDFLAHAAESRCLPVSPANHSCPVSPAQGSQPGPREAPVVETLPDNVMALSKAHK